MSGLPRMAADLPAGVPPGGTSRRRLAAQAALIALAALVPVRSGEQFLYAASFALAFFAFWLWGQALGRGLLGVPRLPFFTSICLGQFAALAAASLATAAGAGSAHLFGAAPGLVFLMQAASLFWLFRERRAFHRVFLPDPPRDLLTPFGIACIAVVVAIYSQHLSALGLDTHEHTAWVEQILRLGYVPMVEPGTNILADYPRTFHLLTAIWTAAGLGLPSGPFVKMMPFLQNALPMLSIAELVEEAAVRRCGGSTRTRWQIALGLGFFAYSFLLVPLVYPWGDLSGTPRFSSAAVLLVPVILLLLAAVHRAPRATAAAWTAVPLLGAWTLTLNPILPLMLIAVTLPLGVTVLVLLKPPLTGVHLSHLAGMAALATAVSILVLAQDPWVTSQIAKRSSSYAALLRIRGILSFDEAVQQGVATAPEKSLRNTPASPPCHDGACVQRLVWTAMGSALSLPARAVAAAAKDARAVIAKPSLPVLRRAFQEALPLPGAAFTDYSPLPFLVVVAAGTILALVRAIRTRRKTAVDPGGFSPERFLAVSLIACVPVGICLAFGGALATTFNDQTHDSWILQVYMNMSPAHVSLALLWLPFAGAWMVLAPRRSPSDPEAASALPQMLRAVALVLWVTLPISGRLNLNVPIRNAGFWSPIHLPDVFALHSIERSIPPGDGVLVPAEHWKVNNWEHWVIPIGPATSLLPYGERRYLFDVYLGASYPLSWRDLEDKLCSREPATRQAFLAQQRAHWLLLRDDGAVDAATALRGQRMCGVPLSTFDVQLPPVRRAGGLWLFRLAAPR